MMQLLALYKYNELYQWDTGRALLIIPDSAGNVPTQVEFEYNDVVIPMTPETDGDNQIVSIPDVCLQQSGLLIAYEVINIDGHTTYNRNMYTIKSKNKPDGYVYEESEILNWHELDARISKLEESSGSSADAVAIDKTLTQSGQAADAAAVGDAISSLSEEITQLSGTTSEITPTQVYNAVSAGRPVKVQYTDTTYGLISYTNFSAAESMKVIAANVIVYFSGTYILAELFGIMESDEWRFMSTTLAKKSDIPTDAYINSLIDARLGVIENGTY